LKIGEYLTKLWQKLGGLVLGHPVTQSVFSSAALSVSDVFVYARQRSHLHTVYRTSFQYQRLTKREIAPCQSVPETYTAR